MLVREDHPHVITRSLTINEDLTWSAHVHGHQLDLVNCSALHGESIQIKSRRGLNRLIESLDKLSVCAGHPDEHFLSLADYRKGKFLSSQNKTIAFTDAYAPVDLNGEEFPRTIRSQSCELLVHGSKCEGCSKYRSTLRALHSQWSCQQRSLSRHTNDRYLRTPQRKERMSQLRTELKGKAKEVESLKKRLQKSTTQNGIFIDNTTEDDLEKIMTEKTEEVRQKFAPDSFQRLFWDQQLDSLKVNVKASYDDPLVPQFEATFFRIL